jgi:uncharacterized coiled-coil protein SlyX
MAGVADPGRNCKLKSTMKHEATTRLHRRHCEQVLLTLGFLALSHMAQAVSPAPDGSYPGGNTAEGQNALFSLTSGTYNTAVGFLSLRNDTAGAFNTAIGAGALLANAGDQNTGAGVENTANGAGALLNNTTGCCNTANGAFALFSNTNSAENSAFGVRALFSNIEANDNSAFGYNALASDTGGGNTAVGAYSLGSNTTGVLNTAVGLSALGGTTGSNNVALGYAAGGGVTTADNVICLGSGGQNISNSCFIGTPGVHANTYIAGIYGAPISGDTATPVYIDSDGKLGTFFSSARFKQDIQSMDNASEAILALRPVTFYYKKELDSKRTAQFGLLAEEVEKVNPDLVTLDRDGKPYTVRYEAVNAMLLNEFLKEHKTVQELKSTIVEQEATITDLKSTVARQQKDFQATVARLTARLDDQAAQIQKVGAQAELNKPAPQKIANK